jgi:hypothetical protein
MDTVARAQSLSPTRAAVGAGLGRLAQWTPASRGTAADDVCGAAGIADQASGCRRPRRHDSRPRRQRAETSPKSSAPWLVGLLAPRRARLAPAAGGSALRGLHGARRCSR